jgi:uncharacterized protein (TIGR02996 family)
VTELEALLFAVRSEPEDDTARLVLADWLQENGQPERAEFIRLQVRNAWFPGRQWSDRECELRDAHEAEWIGHVDTQQNAARVDHRRGMLRVDLFSDALTDDRWLTDELRACFRTGWVEEVWIYGGKVLSVAERAYLAGVPRLLVQGECVKTERVALAETFGSLNLASVSHLALLAGDGPFAPLVRALVDSPMFPKLKGLALQGPFDADVIAALAQGRLAQLARLELDGADLRDGGLTALLDSPVCAGLTALALNHCNIGPDALAALAGSAAFGRLSELVLSGLSLTDEDVEALVRSPHRPSFNHLSFLRWNEDDDAVLTDRAVKALAGWSSLSSVERLRICVKKARFGIDGVRALATSPHLTGLQSLALGGSWLNDAVCAELAAAPNLASLRALVLDGPIGDPTAAALASSPHLERLEYLEVPSTNISEHGWREIVFSPHLRRLEFLGLPDPETDHPLEMVHWRKRLAMSAAD